jgi:hypothetical protein
MELLNLSLVVKLMPNETITFNEDVSKNLQKQTWLFNLLLPLERTVMNQPDTNFSLHSHEFSQSPN